MTDEPPVPSEINEMNSGVTIVEAGNVIDSNPSNDGKIHVVPAAVGAVAPLVNFPERLQRRAARSRLAHRGGNVGAAARHSRSA